ncbi:ribbon-helix-helix domain-containing protein [Granulicella rosea]|nr:type II toxin-antitoxin system ParD family antitoxin [Granulicella rosea]
MTLTLDPQAEQFIQQEIDGGLYANPAEVIQSALELLKADQIWAAEEKADLDRRLTESMAQIDRGEGIPGDRVRDVLAQLRAARKG